LFYGRIALVSKVARAAASAEEAEVKAAADVKALQV
jgi:hypothetical protein